MTEFANDQAHLDADVASLGQATASIETEISNLKAANPAVNFTGLDAALATLQGIAPSAPAPEPTPAPVVTPDPTPADVPPADGSAPTA